MKFVALFGIGKLSFNSEGKSLDNKKLHKSLRLWHCKFTVLIASFAFVTSDEALDCGGCPYNYSPVCGKIEEEAPTTFANECQLKFTGCQRKLSELVLKFNWFKVYSSLSKKKLH